MVSVTVAAALASWPVVSGWLSGVVEVGVVSQPGADTEQ